VQPDGSTPSENSLMNAGTTFSFARLAGESLAALRALDFAYLRDRVVVDAKVTGLYLPPQIASVSPDALPAANTRVTVLGGAFRATPLLRIENDAFAAQLMGESFVSATEVRCRTAGAA
jgi:hypothetical protein